MTYTARRRHPDDPALRAFLLKDRASHLYLLGDLAPPHNPRAQFATSERGGEIVTAALLCREESRSAIMAGGDPLGLLAALDVLPLPRQVAFHLALKEVDVLCAHYDVDWASPQLLMILKESPQTPPPGPEVRRLKAGDLPAVRRLALRVPEVGFTETQYRLNPFFGVIGPSGDLAGVGGFHIYNPAFSIAALGSIGVDPLWRGKGIGRQLMHSLLFEARGLEAVGLLVARDNKRAVGLYESLGFSIHAQLQGGIASLRGEATGG